MDPLQDPSHTRFMKRARALARRGAGRVSPNPMVGAVVVRSGRIVGEGYHLFERKDHAEVVALREAGRRASGAALYLNLEPCAHTGRTPPCVDRILEAGIEQVFVSLRDPDARVSGRGVRRLRRHGIQVMEGLCREEALRLNEKYFHFAATGNPFVLLKLAFTLDGRIATRTGDSRWITGERARREAHRLRYEYDAILVGIGTVLRDDPSLDVRWRRRNRITKVILDPRARIPGRARVFESGDPVIIFHDAALPQKKLSRLPVQAVLQGVPCQNGLLKWREILKRLGRAGVTSLIIEGGGKVAASALRSGVVRKAAFFYGPRLVGSEGVPGVGDLAVDSLKDAVGLGNIRIRRLHPDFLVDADVLR